MIRFLGRLVFHKMFSCTAKFRFNLKARVADRYPFAFLDKFLISFRSPLAIKRINMTVPPQN